MRPLGKRVNIITGHYGSGKTTLAVNFALDAAAAGRRVCLVDLDIVNPYFRAADSTARLERAGVRVIAPVYARTNLDIPALPAEIYSVFDNRSRTVILDVGGDDAGAYALGQYAQLIVDENDYAHFYVINQRRALTQTPEEAVGVLREIEAAGHVPVTALINNTNLGRETDAGVIAASEVFARAVARLSGLPVAFTSVRRELGIARADVYPVEIVVKPPWENS